MTEHKKSRHILSSMYAGIGLGLLIGLIMGLSVTPTVKIILGALASLLGALLGFENKLGNSDGNQSTVERNVKLGSFGIAVVLGIIGGIHIRTNNLFAPTITEKVQTWLDAGYDSASARKYVAYELLKIDPVTGEATAESNEIQNRSTSALFKSSKTQQLSSQLDTTYFNGDIEKAKTKLASTENGPLLNLISSIQKELSEESHMKVLSIIQQMTYRMETGSNNFCDLSTDMIEWKESLAVELSGHLIDLNYENRKDFVSKLKNYFCSIN